MSRFVGPLTRIRFHVPDMRGARLYSWLRRKLNLFPNDNQIGAYFRRHFTVIGSEGDALAKMSLSDIHTLGDIAARPLAEMCGMFDPAYPPLQEPAESVIRAILIQTFHDPALDTKSTREAIARSVH